jgi:L-seryl-tRNA(Ser) seleniumtransferase
MGHVTLLGGSTLSPRVLEAMESANQSYVGMEELLDKSGQAIADMLGVENGCVTSGAYAALVMGIAGILTGGDPEKVARLPDTTGMKNEILIQKKTRYHYDRCITTPGATIVEVGDEEGATAAQLEAAVGPRTAGVLYFGRAAGTPGVLDLADVIAVARKTHIQVIVDAAGEIYPLERMLGIARSGADLVCYGAKYLGSGNSTGILCGKRDAVEAAKRNGFISYETRRNRSIGRGYKLDRQEIIAATVALQEWLAMDHEERLHVQAQRIETLMAGLAGLSHVRAQKMWDQERSPWMRLRLTLDDGLGKSAQAIADELKAGDPAIWVRVQDRDLYVEVQTLHDGEDRLVAERLRQALEGQ